MTQFPTCHAAEKSTINDYYYKIPYFSIDNARVIYTKKSKFVKNEHARYTLEIWNLKNLERLIIATSQARF